MPWCLILLVCLWCAVAHADVSCDGVDDELSSGISISTFLSAATGSLVLTYAPTGAAASNGSTSCGYGESLLSDGSGGLMGLFRNGDLAGADRLCAYNWDGVDASIGATYTVNVRTHLAWVHGAGTLLLYKDGVLVTSVASGDTTSLTSSLRLCRPLAASAAAQGRMIEAKTYNVALTAAQIATEGTSAVHNVIPVAASGRWNFDDCAFGANGDGVTFADRSGNGHPITGSWGANTSGLACGGSSIPYPWGVW
jgi:hypothetical protein